MILILQPHFRQRGGAMQPRCFPLLPIQVGDLRPWHDIDPGPALSKASTVDQTPNDVSLVSLLLEDVTEPSEVSEEILVDRGACLNFSENHPGPCVHDQIDFESPGLAVVEKSRIETPMQAALEDLPHHPTLEDMASEGMMPEFLRGADSEEKTDEARVEKVELGRLDSLLPEVSSPSGDADDQEARFQYGEP